MNNVQIAVMILLIGQLVFIVRGVNLKDEFHEVMYFLNKIIHIEIKVLIILFTALLTSCIKKEPICEIGDTCLVKKHIFNNGTYQPHHSLQALNINQKYTELWGIPYFDCVEKTDTGNVIWNFPQEDLYSINQ